MNIHMARRKQTPRNDPEYNFYFVLREIAGALAYKQLIDNGHTPDEAVGLVFLAENGILHQDSQRKGQNLDYQI